MNPFLKIAFFSLCLLPLWVQAQTVKEYDDSLTVSNQTVTVTVNRLTGKVNYRFSNGASLMNTVAYVEDLRLGRICSGELAEHLYGTEAVNDSIGAGVQINIRHTDKEHPLLLVQHIRLYKDLAYLSVDLEAVSKHGKTLQLETRNISPMAILPSQNGWAFMPGPEPRILDVPFDNDDWTPQLQRKWKEEGRKSITGIGYEFLSVYDNTGMSGMVMGSLLHDFWKTGIAYQAADQLGKIDSLNIFGGAATPDQPGLPLAYGGNDGTHDHAPHGTMTGASVKSPLVYLCGLNDLNQAFKGFGEALVKLNGRRTWKGYAPVYWNSFGVEGVLGYEHVMMPPGVSKISDFLYTLNHFNRYAKPVLSIDSYDQSIYTTELLASLGKYGEKRNQQMGFYFGPFSLWTWKNNAEQSKIPGTDYWLRDVVLRDKDDQPIQYKEGDWACYALDPTHPAIRQTMIAQLQKAKAINAKFIKIDFLTGGALESIRRYNPAIRTGMQAYDYGMRLLTHLIDSIMGPDIFITQAISPMFPYQYAHTRFLSTDVYSHLRDDQKGFPSWGSTEASLATASHMGWVQGTLWPYTNLDVCIMKNFQKNPDLTEQEIKVRLYAMMVMGSILGDGSDFRNKLAADRALHFLNNPGICAFFSKPKAFTPLRFADGETFNQQMVFYLPGDTAMIGLFNFDTTKTYKAVLPSAALHLSGNKYELREFFSGELLGTLSKEQASLTLTVPVKDAVMVKLVPTGKE